MLKIDIISGFLGACKTTFIKRLLDTSLKNEKVVLIENEYGEVSVDTDLLKDSSYEPTEKTMLNNSITLFSYNENTIWQGLANKVACFYWKYYIFKINSEDEHYYVKLNFTYYDTIKKETITSYYEVSKDLMENLDIYKN